MGLAAAPTVRQADKDHTYTTRAFYSADSPLTPSGLMGPVTISVMRRPR